MNQDGPKMHVKVYAPFKVYYDGEANSVSAKNRTGDFDVLAHHKNFMTLLTPCNIVVRNSGKPDFTLPIARGIMHVKADQTTVFLDV
ncbi:MAG TPA: F0F1 ATP synthase subunit epsilon [Candidatus Saccharimonadales bacterium]|nr:F0F1 ATP synthase subunit epsilon [Candidatus Saccharimonadales bacterium]